MLCSIETVSVVDTICVVAWRKDDFFFPDILSYFVSTEWPKKCIQTAPLYWWVKSVYFWGATLYIGFFFVVKPSGCTCSTAVYKPVWPIPLLSVQWINSWWWTDELSETCRFSWQNKFVELVHPDGFITKKKPIYRVAQKMYTHFTLILMSKECIHFFGATLYFG
jgi:hypothetical protein